MDSAFIVAFIGLCYSIWTVTQQAFQVPLWFKITFTCLFGVGSSIPVCVKTYLFYRTKISRRKLLLRALWQFILSDLYRDYSFDWWCEGKAIHCNYLFETDIHFSDHYICIKNVAASSYKDEDVKVYTDDEISFKPDQFMARKENHEELFWCDMLDMEGNYALRPGNVESNELRYYSKFKSIDTHWLEAYFDRRDKLIWFQLRNNKFEGTKVTKPVPGNMRKFAMAMYVLENLDQQGCIEFEKKRFRRGAIVFPCLSPMETLERVANGSWVLHKLEYKTLGQPCIIER